jgi:hypothetical protein
METASTDQSYVRSYAPWNRSHLDDTWTMAVDQF